MSKIISYFKDNVWAILGFILNPIGVLIYLGCVLTAYETNVPFRFTIWGLIILAIFAIVVLVKLNSRFKAMKHSVGRGLLLSIVPAIIWLGGFVICWALQNMGNDSVMHWCICGVFFVASRFCYIMDEIKKSN